MLSRLFRLLDKLINALLMLGIWLGLFAARQLYALRRALVALLGGSALLVGGAYKSGRNVYATGNARRAGMAQQNNQINNRTIVREDPLRAQNRALSLFTVLLLLGLIGAVLLGGANRPTDLAPTAEGNVSLPMLPTVPTTTPTPTPTITPTPIPDPLRVGGSIVYALRQNGRQNLYAVGIGQSEPLRLTNTPVDDRDPVWSPDGGRIAFSSRRDGNWDLYVLEVATGSITRLTITPNYEASPSWSPDGAFIAYEAYDNDNLDIYIVAASGGGTPIRLTYNPAPDYSPAWGPAPDQLRRIAYVSARTGNAELYVISLDRPVEEEATRLTNTPAIDEDYPAWSPDGAQIAYSALADGIDLVFTKRLDRLTSEPTTLGRGREPAWSPDGNSILFALDAAGSTTLVSALVGGIGVASPLAIAMPGRAGRPHWTKTELPDSLISSGGVRSEDTPLYTEGVAPEQASPPYYQFRRLTNINAAVPILSDRVDDSFNALREAVLQKAGYDFLGNLQDALWTRDRLPEPGTTRQNWHYTGRAFSFDRNLIFNEPSPIEIVREDIGANTFWRIYLRVDVGYQDGRLGEPLKKLPWDFASRTLTNDPEVFEQGGRRKAAIPKGYFIDFTQLASDYGWERLPAERQWRSNFPSIFYWEFVKREGLSWEEAMFELYTQQEIDAFLFGPTPVPTRDQQPTFTPARSSPTPIPPA
jgi:TolB protein